MSAVLVVDDEPAIADLLADLLREEGYETIVAQDGLAAFAVLQAQTPVDLVITDAMMPRCDGVELVRRMRDQTRLRGIPVIMLSAGTAPALDGLGVTIFLRKPFEMTALLNVIARVLPSLPSP